MCCIWQLDNKKLKETVHRIKKTHDKNSDQQVNTHEGKQAEKPWKMSMTDMVETCC
jgi:hypothetical protein